jgi:hypothetical protein
VYFCLTIFYFSLHYRVIKDLFFILIDKNQFIGGGRRRVVIIIVQLIPSRLSVATELKSLT